MIVQSNKEISINSSFAHAKAIEDEIVQAAEQAQYPEDAIFAIRLSLEEALTNAIRHGNARDCGKKVHVGYCVNEEAVKIRIADEGKGFDPETVPDPTRTDRLEMPSGRGILLMRTYMDEVRFTDRGNEVFMVKYNRPDIPEDGIVTRGDLALGLKTTDGVTLVSLAGSADMAEAHALSDTLDRMIDEGRTRLVIDLSDLTFINSMGLGAFIKAHNLCRQQGGSLFLANPQPAVRRVLRTTRLDEFFPLYKAVAQAMQAAENLTGKD